MPISLFNKSTTDINGSISMTTTQTPAVSQFRGNILRMAVFEDRMYHRSATRLSHFEISFKCSLPSSCHEGSKL